MNVSRRKGFTLVELLIVIVVIGVLAAMMMLSSTEAVTSAKATSIINNLQAFRRAGLAYYADNMGLINVDPAGYQPKLDNPRGRQIVRYFDKSITDDKTLEARANELIKEGYGFIMGFNSSGNINRWYVKYDLKDSRIKEKLAGRAESLNLLGTVDTSNAPDDWPDEDELPGTKAYDGTQDTVYLRIR